ncbi:DinB family protein [Bacillus tuaregi]|uniref:DinB family protein n=1 Tax=Bacillus tuaregi TaxID=1816695 RepID=UPI0008F7F603|nr:DinB family protein [Bacillus tuaregi]
MKEHGIHMLQYDYWANMKLLTHVDSFNEDIFHKPLKSVFPSIADTFYHIFRGQRIWIKRCIPDLSVNENITSFQDIEQAKTCFSKLHTTMIDLIHLSYDELNEVVYQNSRGTTFTNHIDEIMHHLANHGTYHRGNIASMIRECGYNGTSTDYIQFLRDMKN